MDNSNHDEIVDPNEEYLWRYMDLPKFLNLLSTSSLYFGSPNFFADKLEGMAFSKELLPMHEAYAKYTGKEANHASINHRQIALRPYYLISCWNRAHSESVALWNMYAAGINGVAIQTTKEALDFELTTAKKDYVSRDVQYRKRWLMNFSKEDSIEPFFWKSDEWAFENEYRVLIDMTKDDRFKTEEQRAQIDNINLGHHVPVNLHRLIKDIRVHYKAPHYHLEDVRKLVGKFDLQPGLVSNSVLVDSL